MSRFTRVEKYKDYLRKAKEKNPVEIERGKTGVKITPKKEAFIPEDSTDDKKVFLLTVHGRRITAEEVKIDRDERILYWKDSGTKKSCAICSEPLIKYNNEYFFTKPSFMSTVAINEDTLLRGDVFNSDTSTYERKLSKDVNLEAMELSEESDKVEVKDDHYLVEADAEGEVETLIGSKTQFNQITKNELIKTLLKPNTVAKSKMIMYIGIGLAGGYFLYPQLQ